MKGIVTILPKPLFSQVRGIWKDIEQKFGIDEVKIMPFPHFTWHIADEYDMSAVKNELNKLCELNKPFEIETTGLAYFKNELFVAYNGIKKNSALKTLHKKLCNNISKVSENPIQYYLPNEWTPHITLVFEARGTISEPGKLNKYLSEINLKWKFNVDNFNIMNHDSKQGTDIVYKAKMKY